MRPLRVMSFQKHYNKFRVFKHALLLLFFVITILCVDSIFINQLNAQTTSTSCVRTKVGNPTDPEPPFPPECTTSGTANDLVEAAEQVKNAYDKCGPDGYTHDNAAMADCLKDFYTNLGYSTDKVALIESRRQQSLIDSPNVSGGNCSECLGYVGIVGVVWTNNNDPCCNLSYPAAGDINTVGGSFKVGSYTFTSIGSNIDAQVQPGDIAVAGGTGNAGHIAIVKEVIGNAKVVFIESNGNLDCRITNTRESIKDGYTFYRKQ